MRRESHVRFWESAGVRFPRATRLVRSIKEECLSRVIPFGECRLRRTIVEYVEHYHRERTSSGNCERPDRRRVGDERDWRDSPASAPGRVT